VRLTQKRFLNFGLTVPDAPLWRAPIGLEYSDGAKTRTRFVLLAGPDTTIQLEGSRPPEWIHPNSDEAGYYRWNVSPEMMEKLAESGIDAMTPRERVGLLGNLKALLSAGITHGDDYMRLLSRFADDPDPQVVAAMLDGIAVVHLSFVTPDLAGPYASYIRRTLGPALQRFGLTKRPSESEGVSLVRRLMRTGDRTSRISFRRFACEEYLGPPWWIRLGSVALHLSAIRGSGDVRGLQATVETAQVPGPGAVPGGAGPPRPRSWIAAQLRAGRSIRPQEIFTIPGVWGAPSTGSTGG
jgi:hypothetical protein